MNFDQLIKKYNQQYVQSYNDMLGPEHSASHLKPLVFGQKSPKRQQSPPQER